MHLRTELLPLALGLALVGQSVSATPPPASGRTPTIGKSENLLDPELSHWDIFMGAPHTTTDIEGYEKFDDVTKGTPIGLNKDPKHVFTTRQENGETVLVITGEIFAGLVTKQVYENYHFSCQFKWDEKKWAPRLDQKRNSGVLYHSTGKNTDFWNVWMSCLEFEVMEHDCGDLITLGEVRAEAPAAGSGKKYTYESGSKPVLFSWGNGCETGRCVKSSDTEKPNGEWNKLDLYCIGNQSFQVVNGVVVMHVLNPEIKVGDKWIAMNKGKIQLQSEAAALCYKEIHITPIDRFPEEMAALAEKF